MKNILTIGSVGAKIAIVLTATVGGVALVGSSVFASLTATASNALTPQSISSGSLALSLNSDTGSAGFTTSISNMIPGDTQYRFVTYTQASAAATTPTLQITDAASTALTADTIRGLAVTVSNCSTLWTFTAGVNPAPTCAGSTSVLGSTPLVTLKTAQPLGLGFILTAGSVNHLAYAISMPSGVNETNSNGATTVGNSPYAITAINGNGTTVTYSTASTTGLAVGEQITVTGASVTGYNNTFVITAVTAGSFSVTNATTAAATTAIGNLPTIQGLTSTITWTVSEAQRGVTSTNG